MTLPIVCYHTTIHRASNWHIPQCVAISLYMGLQTGTFHSVWLYPYTWGSKLIPPTVCGYTPIHGAPSWHTPHCVAVPLYMPLQDGAPKWHITFSPYLPSPLWVLHIVLGVTNPEGKACRSFDLLLVLLVVEERTVGARNSCWCCLLLVRLHLGVASWASGRAL